MLRVTSLHTLVSHRGEANLDCCTVVCASLGVIFPSDLVLGGLTRAYGAVKFKSQGQSQNGQGQRSPWAGGGGAQYLRDASLN